MVDESEEFRIFSKRVEAQIEKYGHGKFHDIKDWDGIQKEQVERLISLEIEFKKTLIRHRWGKRVYEAFISFICDEKKNILFARPYFRTRKEEFHGDNGIVRILEQRKWRSLLKYPINYLFVAFVLKAAPWTPKSKIVQLADRIKATRIELMEMNLPLAISRSRMFWSKTPKAHLTFFDFIQFATEGFMSGIDKFTPPYDDIFRSVLIQRASGIHIEEYSKTHLHFYPADRRKIYRANKFLSRHTQGGYEQDDLVASINVDIPADKHTNGDEVNDLLLAASTVSADTRAPGDVDVPNNICRYEAPEDLRPDILVERNELVTKLYNMISLLPLIDQKLLRMKGVNPTTLLGGLK